MAYADQNFVDFSFLGVGTYIESDLKGPLHGRNPILLKLVDVILGHLSRHESFGTEGDGARCNHFIRPTIGLRVILLALLTQLHPIEEPPHLLDGNGLAVQPGRNSARLASGVAHLDRHAAVLAVGKVDNLLERGHLAVLPEAGVLRTDAALGRHGVHFGENQGGAARRKAAEMLSVPRGYVAVLGRVSGGSVSGDLEYRG